MPEVADEKDWLSDGLDSVEKILNAVQESYDSLPDKEKAQAPLSHAQKVISEEIGKNYSCSFSNTPKALTKLSKGMKRLKDPDKAYRRVERAISKDVRECFKAEYGEIL